ncbi:hypothetical protein QG37_08257 [Candidozyma auris]|nr:hypothetical protein QG37_08257 [[Candida] auris]
MRPPSAIEKATSWNWCTRAKGARGCCWSSEAWMWIDEIGVVMKGELSVNLGWRW